MARIRRTNSLVMGAATDQFSADRHTELGKGNLKRVFLSVAVKVESYIFIKP